MKVINETGQIRTGLSMLLLHQLEALLYIAVMHGVKIHIMAPKGIKTSKLFQKKHKAKTIEWMPYKHS
jgi:hypothetical protein